MRILADRNMTGVEALFAPLGEVTLFDGRALTPGDLADADILLVRSVTRVDAALLAEHRPRFVGTATSGFDHVDREWLAAQGIPFAHAPGSNADSVVDYVLSVLSHHRQHLERLLSGEPLGIVGYGHIGRRLRERLSRLGIRCRAYDPWLTQATPLTDLEEVLACPVVSLHAALTGAEPWPSWHMLDAGDLSTLPRDSLLLNAGRGELIATEALLALRDERPDVRLALDVWEGEPVINRDLLDMTSVGTAHIAGYSFDGKLRATRMLRDAACSALAMDPIGGGAELAAVEVEAPAGCSSEDLLCWLVAQVYDVREDDEALRSNPAAFDRLRREYRRRRELSAITVVNAGLLDEAALTTCNALGVRTC